MHNRTLNIQKNILASFLLKGISTGVMFLLVPLTLDYLDQERYGLWLTLSSIISWFGLFDIGLGNGFRNKFAEAIAVKNDLLAKTYVSTTFVLLSIIIGSVLAIFITINPFLNWGRILNTDAESRRTLSILAMVIFSFFALRFVFKLTTSIFLADQKSMLVDLVGVLGNLLSLILIFTLMQLGRHSLLYLGLALAGSPVLVLIIVYFIVFNGKYKKYKPSFSFVDFKQSKGLVGLGFLFFIPQMCSMLILSSSNIVITQIFSPAEVAIYNIAYKYFTLALVFYHIILHPFWSAFTEAYVKQDFVWIKNAIRKLVLIWAVSCIGVMLMVLLSGFAYRIWVGDRVNIPLSLTIGLAIYVCIHGWCYIFNSFATGVSKLVLHLSSWLIIGLFFIPLAILLTSRIGLVGMPIALIISMVPQSIISPLQYKKIISGTAAGIWNR